MGHCNFVGASTSGIPNGHISWNFGKKKKKHTCHFLKYCNLWISKTKCYQEALASLKLDTLMQVSSCRIKVWIGLEGSIWVLAQHEELESSWFVLNIVRSSKFLKFKFLKNMIWPSILCERLRIFQPIICKVVPEIVHHIEKMQIIKEIKWNKGGLSKRSIANISLMDQLKKILETP